MLLLLATASAAHAALAVPILTDTNPVSPGASLTPRIMGEFEGSETKAVPFGIGLRAAGPVTKSLAEPDNTVRIYTSAGCAGPVAAEGTAEELAEGSGIQVDSAVAADLVTIFYATQSKPGETSGCSVQGLPYRQVTNPPAAPTFSSVAPASPANENFPRLIGTADPEASVSIFAGPSCADTALASGSGAQFGGAGIVVGVLDNSENTFSARAAIAGFTSSCSVTPIVYHEVTPVSPPGGGGGGGGESPGGGGGAPPATPSLPPPAPHLRTIPGGWANNNTPLLTGTAPGASTVRIFADPACAGTPVAKASFEQFTAGVPVQVIDNAATVFSAVAVNGSGRASSCSQPVIYVEDSLTPRTRITMGPAAKTAKRKAVFRFIDTTGNAPGTTFFCKVDKHRWKPCASPLRLGKLRPRAYVIQVKAIDPAGNAETKGAKRRFKVVSRP
ncbi:MAG TPA: hypothetical protein VFI03_02320 [Solirubrobacterales bacterium]|nr:hypothetical protein [Solirubrobacterales bacterium]